MIIHTPIFLKFPSQSVNEISHYLSLLSEFNETLNITKGNILFDCEDIQFIRPFGINLLSAMIFYHLQHGNKVLFKGPKDSSVHKYLLDQGFFQEFNIEQEHVTSMPRSTSVALRRLEGVDGTYLDNIANWLNYNGDIPLRVAQDLVSISLLEAINNVFDHSQSSIGCYISAQAYHKQNQLSLSILDFGIGLLNSLKPFYPDIKDDVEAINKAVLEGVSSKRKLEKRVRGVGLTNISGFLKNRGSMEIISYKGYWFQNHEGTINTRMLSCPLKGTCVNLYIDKQSILDISDMGEEVWGE